MNKICYTLKMVMCTMALSLGCLIGKSQFTVGNLVIYRVGTGSGNLLNTGNAVFLDEYTPTGTLVQSVPMPTAVSGSNKRLIASGTATSEGGLARSTDKRYLVLSGYDAPIPTTGLASTAGTAVNRTVALVDNAETVNTTTGLTDFATGNNPRSAFSTDGTDIWVAGGAGGVRYTTVGNSTSTQLSTTITNIRNVYVFNGQLYISTSSGSAVRIGTVGTGNPTTSGQTITNLPGLSGSAGSPYGFFFADLSAGVAGVDVLYVANDDATALTKYSLVGGNWTSNGTVGVAADAYRGVTGVVSGTTVTLYATRKGGSSAAGGGEFVSLVDNSGYNGAFSGSPTLLATAGNNTAFRGIALAPEPAVVIPTVSLSVSSNTGSEAAASVITVTATASAPVTGAQTVDVAVTGTNITAGDYNLSNTTITIPNGATTGSVTFTVVDDAVVESTETATLTISNPSAGIALGSPVNQNITITDNDVALPTVSLSASANSGAEANTTVITLTATASAPVSGNQTVTLGASGAGITVEDYFLSGTTITILNGQTTGTATFTVRNDAETEGTETAVLTISNPSAGITLGTPVTQNVAITDNTCQPLIRKSTATSTNGAEISAFDPASNRVYTVAGPAMEYYTMSNTGVLTGPSNLPFGFAIPGGTNVLPNSVAVKNGVVAVSYAVVNTSSSAQQPGIVAFYQAATGTYINHVTVGYLPDMVVFSPDGTKVLTANEGEPNSYGQGNSFDPEGSVSIIDIAGGVASATVQTAGFTSFNSQMASLKAAGVRIFGPGATVAQDLEPEYIAFGNNGTRAYVTLQENNAVAEVDIASATVLQILPLGLKNHNLPGNGLDASDRDLAPAFSAGTINIQNWPIYGMYMPDAIASFTVGGNTYFITANEGDSRAYTGFSEEVRVGAGSYVLDPTIFPNAATLKLNQNLGRLQLTNATGDLDGDGDIDQIQAFGARSFSIWNSSFVQVFDSGDQLEQITAAQNPASFNSDGTSASFDTRSDNKGPEPEAVTTGVVNGVLYAFVGSERTGDIFVYDISNPNAPVFKQYIDNPADAAVEGLLFVPAHESPTGKALVIATAELSFTVTVYEFSLVAPQLPTVNTALAAVQGVSTMYGDCAGLIAKVNQNGGSPIAGNVDAKVWIESSVPAVNGLPFVQRHYEITPTTNAAAATGRVTLYFTQGEFDNFNNDPASALDLPTGPSDGTGIGNLRVVKYPGTSNDGSGLPASYSGTGELINPADVDIVWNVAAARWEVTFDVTGFSGFIVQTNSTLLPLTLLNWGVQVQGDDVLTQWKSSNEVNHAYYEVQYSATGTNFLPVGNLPAQSGTGEKQYNLTHYNAAAISDKLYYRLKMVSASGAVTYSNVLLVRLGKKAVRITDVLPNPVTTAVTVVATGESRQPIQVFVADMSGKVVLSRQITANSTSNINMSNLAAGLYLLKALLPDGTQQQFKLIKQ